MNLTRFFADLRRVLGPTALVRVVRQLLANDGMAYAGQLAYFFVLFLFPFLIFLVSLGGLVVENPASGLKSLFTSTRGFLPQAAVEIMVSHLDRALQNASPFTFFVSGVLTLVAGAASAESIISAANRSYGVEETRPSWKRWAIAVFLIFGFTLLVATMVFLVLSPQVGAYLQRVFGLPGSLANLWDVLSWMIVFFNLTLAFAILYYVSPNADVPFKWATPGGLVITVLLLASSKIFILWASYVFRSTELYGQLGAGVVLLIWLFIIGLVVLAGVEINAVLARMAEEHRGAEIVRPPKGDSWTRPARVLSSPEETSPEQAEADRNPVATLIQFFADLKRVSKPAALVRAVRQLLANAGIALAGQLAYFFVLFLFPFLIFMVTLVGLVVENPEPILIGITARMQGVLPEQAIEPVRNHLSRTLQRPSSPTFISSILFTLGVGSAAAQAITNAANRSYGVEETRPFWKVRGVAVLLIFGFTFLVAALAFTVLSAQTGAYLRQVVGLPDTFLGLWSILSWLLTFFVVTFALSLLYYLAPNVVIPFRWFTPGGFMATILLVFANQIIIIWASNTFRYDRLYDQLGASIVFLVWLYVVGLVILIGIEINAVLARMAGARKDVETLEHETREQPENSP